MHHGHFGPRPQSDKMIQSVQSPFGRLLSGTAAERPSRDSLNDLHLLMIDAGQNELDSSDAPAGFTFFGQFIDHDITLMSPRDQDEKPLTGQASISDVINNRTPDLELDSVFGLGPEHSGSARLYREDYSLKTGADTHDAPWDLPREAPANPQAPSTRQAIIGDGRNDENKLIAQIHLAFIYAYNRMLGEVMAGGGHTKGTASATAKVRLYQTYQYLVLNDYLPRFTKREILDKALAENAPLYKEMIDSQNNGEPMMPLEFSVAAFRFGHSQVRSGYLMNTGGNAGRRLFSDADQNVAVSDLNGGVVIDRQLQMDMNLFFSDANPFPAPFNRARRIDASLALPLFSLEPPGIPAASASGNMNDNPRSLGHRNLLRGRQFDLLNGFEAADALAAAGYPITKLTEEQLGSGDLPLPAEVTRNPPLWFYILKEAEVQTGGVRLGDVGSAILAETFVGVLTNTRNSFLKLQGPNWTPPDGLTTMAKLMDYANLPAPPPAPAP
jgi:hypothetical protein